MNFSGTVEDQIAIRSLLEAYGDAVAMRDAKAWGDTWAEDAVWELLGQQHNGRDAIVATWQAMMDGFEFTGFSMGVGNIAVDGDRAKLRVHVSEELWGKDGSKTHVRGRYDDDLIRTADGWRFAARRYTVLKMF